MTASGPEPNNATAAGISAGGGKPDIAPTGQYFRV